MTSHTFVTHGATIAREAVAARDLLISVKATVAIATADTGRVLRLSPALGRAAID